MILKADYGPHAAFIAPARASAAVWRLIAGLVFIVVAYVALSRMFFQFLYDLFGNGAAGFYQTLFSGNTPGSMLVLLASFGFMTVSVAVTVRLVHRRAARSLLGPPRAAVSQFFRVFWPLCLFSVVLFMLPPWDMGGDYVPNLSVSLWLVLLPAALLGVLIQVSAEEILFRGYIQQQLAARFRSPLIWGLLPAGLFALGHYAPQTTGENALIIAIWAGLFGVLMADITARAGTLGPAIALHFWNNVSAIVIVGMPDDLGGLALYHTPLACQTPAPCGSGCPWTLR
ncbi:CPBP family intramembrane glutamic endopeptidase [Sulfitobacter aestuariivivens]|uniref:CPBP family intramembrane glutamic endopeptidase n=1 Tax=Sulfitobacter aestuariivivens TaxID=2766981 RepID=UPI003616B6B7